MAVLLVSCLGLAGCEGDATETDIIENSSLPLRGEQVVLTPDQVSCGEKAGLWRVEQVGGGAVARLEQPGQKLFGDDVRMGDRKYTGPVVQLAGDGKVKVKKISSITPEGTTGKVVTASVGVLVDHACFSAPLPLLGIDRGDFSQDAEPRIHLREHNGWTADKVLH